MGWGLGHATRSIPLIDYLSQKNEIILASNGLSKILLKNEFPNIECISFPDYAIRYPKNKSLLLLSLLFQIPGIIKKLFNEYHLTQSVIDEKNIDIVISDCRYGVFSKKIPSYFITHQLRFQLPIFLKCFEPLGDFFNIFMFRFYNYIIIPDIKELPNLTGDLSHKGIISKYSKLKYLGVFCNVSKLDINEDIDFLISISGPEIQRTLFEKLLLDQIDSLSGKIVVVLGKPGSDNSYRHKNVEIYNHVSRKKQNELLNRAKLIICRSGYTTVMELTALNKIALLIPTPGQTEQEYLAKYYKKTGLFNVAEQKKLNISKEIKKIRFDKKIKLLNIPINDVNAFEKLLEDE